MNTSTHPAMVITKTSPLTTLSLSECQRLRIRSPAAAAQQHHERYHRSNSQVVHVQERQVLWPENETMATPTEDGLVARSTALQALAFVQKNGSFGSGQTKKACAFVDCGDSDSDSQVSSSMYSWNALWISPSCFVTSAMPLLVSQAARQVEDEEAHEHEDPGTTETDTVAALTLQSISPPTRYLFSVQYQLASDGPCVAHTLDVYQSNTRNNNHRTRNSTHTHPHPHNSNSNMCDSLFVLLALIMPFMHHHLIISRNPRLRSDGVAMPVSPAALYAMAKYAACPSPSLGSSPHSPPPQLLMEWKVPLSRDQWRAVMQSSSHQGVPWTLVVDPWGSHNQNHHYNLPPTTTTTTTTTHSTSIAGAELVRAYRHGKGPRQLWLDLTPPPQMQATANNNVIIEELAQCWSMMMGINNKASSKSISSSIGLHRLVLSSDEDDDRSDRRIMMIDQDDDDDEEDDEEDELRIGSVSAAASAATTLLRALLPAKDRNHQNITTSSTLQILDLRPFSSSSSSSDDDDDDGNDFSSLLLELIATHPTLTTLHVGSWLSNNFSILSATTTSRSRTRAMRLVHAVRQSTSLMHVTMDDMTTTSTNTTTPSPSGNLIEEDKDSCCSFYQGHIFPVLQLNRFRHEVEHEILPRDDHPHPHEDHGDDRLRLLHRFATTLMTHPSVHANPSCSYWLLSENSDLLVELISNTNTNTNTNTNLNMIIDPP